MKPRKEFPETDTKDIVIITAAAIGVAFIFVAILGEMTGHINGFVNYFGV